MRSRTSEPGSISQKRARSKSGPSAGTATVNRVTATVLPKSPIVEKPPADVRRTEGDEEGILADGRGDWSGGGSAGGFPVLVPLGGLGLRLLLGGLLLGGSLRSGRLDLLFGLGGGLLGDRGAILGRSGLLLVLVVGREDGIREDRRLLDLLPGLEDLDLRGSGALVRGLHGGGLRRLAEIGDEDVADVRVDVEVLHRLVRRGQLRGRSGLADVGDVSLPFAPHLAGRDQRVQIGGEVGGRLGDALGLGAEALQLGRRGRVPPPLGLVAQPPQALGEPALGRLEARELLLFGLAQRAPLLQAEPLAAELGA